MVRRNSDSQAHKQAVPLILVCTHFQSIRNNLLGFISRPVMAPKTQNTGRRRKQKNKNTLSRRLDVFSPSSPASLHVPSNLTLTPPPPTTPRPITSRKVGAGAVKMRRYPPS